MIKKILVPVLILVANVIGTAYASDVACDKALKLFNAGQYGPALPHLEKCASHKPDPAVYYMLGYSYYELNDHERSMEYFDQTFLIDPDFAPGSLKTLSLLSEPDGKLIDELLELSGARAHIKSYAAVLSRGIPVVHSGMKTGKYMAEIRKIINDSWSEDEMFRSVRKSYAAGFRRDHAAAAREWLRTDAGMRLGGTGLSLDGPEKKPSLLLAGVRGHAGMELVIRLEKAMRYTELASEVISISMFGMMKGIQSELQEQSMLDSDEIDLLLSDIRKYAKDELEPDIMLKLLDICRDITDEEILNAIRFYSSPEGTWLVDMNNSAFSEALGSAAKELGIRIGRSVMPRDIPL